MSTSSASSPLYPKVNPRKRTSVIPYCAVFLSSVCAQDHHVLIHFPSLIVRLCSPTNYTTIDTDPSGASMPRNSHYYRQASYFASCILYFRAHIIIPDRILRFVLAIVIFVNVRDRQARFISGNTRDLRLLLCLWCLACLQVSFPPLVLSLVCILSIRVLYVGLLPGIG